MTATKKMGEPYPIAPTAASLSYPMMFETAATLFMIAIFAGTIFVQLLLGIDDMATDPKAGLVRFVYLGLYAVILGISIFYYRRMTLLLIGSLLLIFFHGFLFFSVLWSVDPGATIRGAIALTMTAVFGFYLIARYGSYGAAQLIYYTLLGLIVLSTVLAIITPDLAIHSDSHQGSWRGIFVHKNVAGNVGVWLVPLILYLANGQKISWRSALISILATLAFVVMTGSQTSLVVALAMILLQGLCIFLTRDIRLAASFAILALVSISLIIFVIYALPDLFAAILGRDATFTGRVFIWEELRALIAQKPMLGYGYSAIWDVTYGPLYRFIEDWQISAGHNSFLDLLLDVGVIGFTIFAILMLNFLRKSLLLLRYGDPASGAFGIMAFTLIILLSLSESIVPTGHKIHWVMLTFALVSIDIAYRALPARSGIRP